MIRSVSNSCSVRFDAGTNRGYTYTGGKMISIDNFEKLYYFLNSKFTIASGNENNLLVPLDLLTDILIHYHACKRNKSIQFEPRIIEGKIRYNMVTRRFEGDMSNIEFSENWFEFKLHQTVDDQSYGWKLVANSTAVYDLKNADKLNGIVDIDDQKTKEFYEDNAISFQNNNLLDPSTFFENRFIVIFGIVHNILDQKATIPYYSLYPVGITTYKNPLYNSDTDNDYVPSKNISNGNDSSTVDSMTTNSMTTNPINTTPMSAGASIRDDVMERLTSLYVPKSIRLLIYFHLLKKNKLTTSNLIGEAVVNIIIGLCINSRLFTTYLFDLTITNITIAIYLSLSRYTKRKIYPLEVASIIMIPYYALVV